MHGSSARLWMVTVVWVVATGLVARASGQPSLPPSIPAQSGRTLYETACAACHGNDGRGAPRSTVGFETALPDFTDCGFATPEPDADWLAVIHGGGPARSFDRRMPAFGEALQEAELQRIVEHLRTFCVSRAWPRGELNLPRALITEKAFPENEAVLTTTVDVEGAGAIGNEFLYERRLGARGQFEIAVPLLVEQHDSAWYRGFGDIAVAIKHALFHSIDRGSIVSAGAELILPTGRDSVGLGGGVTVFEPSLMFGQLLPADAFVQLQAGAELPVDTAHAGRETFWRGVVGKTFTHGRFGRAWSPMVELVAAKVLDGGQPAQWDLIPQLQVTLSRRQHVMINGGVRVPLNDRDLRRTQVVTYFLWDWFDGGLVDGWR